MRLMLAMVVLAVGGGFLGALPPGVTTLELSAGATLGALLTGYQKTVFAESLTPQPDSFSLAAVQGTVRVYPNTWFGAALGGQLGLLQVSHGSSGSQAKARKILTVLSLPSVQAGLVARTEPIEAWNSRLSFQLEGGATWSAPSYSSDYSSLVPAGYHLYDLLPGWGYYGSVRGVLVNEWGFLVSVGLEVATRNGSIDTSGKFFDGLGLVLPVHLGWAW